MAVSLDGIDVELLAELQADADRTNVELARLVGLSPAATLHRVRRLKESGVIRVIRAQLDPVAAGFPLHRPGQLVDQDGRVRSRAGLCGRGLARSALFSNYLLHER